MLYPPSCEVWGLLLWLVGTVTIPGPCGCRALSSLNSSSNSFHSFQEFLHKSTEESKGAVCRLSGVLSLSLYCSLLSLTLLYILQPLGGGKWERLEWPSLSKSSIDMPPSSACMGMHHPHWSEFSNKKKEIFWFSSWVNCLWGQEGPSLQGEKLKIHISASLLIRPALVWGLSEVRSKVLSKSNILWL